MYLIFGLSVAFLIFLVGCIVVELVKGIAGLAFNLVALALKLLPLVLAALVVLFFVQGGKVGRDSDGKVKIDLPDSWHKRS